MRATATAAATGIVRLERRRIDLSRDAARPAEEPLLEDDRRKRQIERGSVGDREFAANERLDRVHAQLIGDDDKRKRDEDRDQRLNLPVPVGMFLVRRSRPVADAQDDGDVGHQVRDGMDGVRQERLGGKEESAGTFQCGDRDVYGHARVGNAAHVPDFVFSCHFQL